MDYKPYLQQYLTNSLGRVPSDDEVQKALTNPNVKTQVILMLLETVLQKLNIPAL